MAIQNPEILIAQKAKEKLVGIQVDTDFKNFLKGLPSMIVQNGLIQTLAFIKGKSEERYKKLYSILDEFFRDYFLTPEGAELPNSDILEYLVDNLNDIRYYTFYQKGMLSFTIWLKRFALALYE